MLKQIPPGIYLGVSAALMVGSVIVNLLRMKDTPLGKIIASAREGFLKPEMVDAAAEQLLSRIGIPMAFADLIGDLLAELVKRVPAFNGASADHLRSTAASAFGRVGYDKAKEVLPSIPDDVLASKFGRTRTAERLLAKMDPKLIVAKRKGM